MALRRSPWHVNAAGLQLATFVGEPRQYARVTPKCSASGRHGMPRPGGGSEDPAEEWRGDSARLDRYRTGPLSEQSRWLSHRKGAARRAGQGVTRVPDLTAIPDTSLLVESPDVSSFLNFR
jgi:hypothetical protein